MGKMKATATTKQTQAAKRADTPPASRERLGRSPEPTRRAPTRPDLRITAKISDDSAPGGYIFVPIAAYWRDSTTGFLQGGLDKVLSRITIETSDGAQYEITPGAPGEFVNAYEKRSE